MHDHTYSAGHEHGHHAGEQSRALHQEDSYQDVHDANGGDDSDDDNETLSPTDGYFHASHSAATHRHEGELYARAPNVVIENSNHYRHHHHHHHHHHQHNGDDVDAPPSPSSSGYNTIGGSTALNSPVGDGAGGILGLVPEELRRLLPRSGHQDMQLMSNGGGGYGYDDGRRRPWWAWRNLRRKLTTVLGVLVAVSVLTAMMELVLDSSEDGDGDGHRPLQPGPLEPPSGDLSWPYRDKCRDAPRRAPTVTSRVQYKPGRNLTVVQDVRSGMGRHPLIGGELIFLPMTTDSLVYDDGRGGEGSLGEIDVEMLANYREADTDPATSVVTYDEDAQSLIVSVPPAGGWHWSPSPLLPCIQIRVTVRVPPGAVLDMLDVRLAHLDVDILPGLQLDTTVSSTIATAAGYVRAASPAMTTSGQQRGQDAYELGSRRIDISTTSGSIVGWYPLYDLLRIQSQSGSIDVRVGHKHADPASPDTPATLQLATQSGSIAAVSVLGDSLSNGHDGRAAGAGLFPPREYVTAVQSNSGAIRVETPFSSSGHFKSVNGGMDLVLWPVVTPSTRPQLSTSATSGHTTLTLREPSWIDEHGVTITTLPSSASPSSASRTRLTKLRADHTSVSGSIAIRYPSAWEGTVRADTVSGSQSLRGEGLTVRRGGGLVERVLEGRKGEITGDSFISVHTVSGSEDFLVV